MRTAASYGIEAVLKSGEATLHILESRVFFLNLMPFVADKWVPCKSPAVKQEAPVTPSNRFSFSLENLNLPQIIAEEEPLLRDSAEKFGSAQADSGGVDKARKQLTGAIRDSFSGLSRSSIRFETPFFALEVSTCCIIYLTAGMLMQKMVSATSCQKFHNHQPRSLCRQLKRPVASEKQPRHNCRCRSPAVLMPMIHTPTQNSGTSADFLSPRERILALRDSKKAKRFAAAAPAARAVVGPLDADSSSSANSGDWPLAAITESLVADLLSPTWFVRHGCAMGLIEILSAAGSCAGCCDGLDTAQQLAANAEFLGGVAACLLVVLALDRYADFDSQVRVHFLDMCNVW